MHNAKIVVDFKGSCFKLDKSTFTHRIVVNLFIFIIYGLDTCQKI